MKRILAAAACLPFLCGHALAFTWSPRTSNPALTDLDPVQSKLYAVCSTKKVLSSYFGPLFNVIRAYDGANEDVYPTLTGWPSVSALQAWSQGTPLYVDTCYDQTGLGNSWTETTSSNYPSLDLTGGEPAIYFDGFASHFNAPLGFLNNVSGFSTILVDQRQTTDTTSNYEPLYFSTSASISAPQFYTGQSNLYNFQDIPAGKRNTGDSTTSLGNALTTYPVNTSWQVQSAVANFNATSLYWQNSNSNTKTNAAWLTTGVTPSANAQAAYFGEGNGAPWFGYVTLAALSQTALSTATIQLMTTNLQNDLEPPAAPAPIPFMWGNAPRTTTTITAPPTGLQFATVMMPNGATPVQGIPATYQYNHLSAVGALNGQICVEWGSNQSPETPNGISVSLECSTTLFATNQGLQLAFPSQSTWGDTSANARAVTPSGIVTYQGQMYATATLAYGNNQTPPTPMGIAKLAAVINADGTVGTPFIIAPNASVSYASYTAQAGFPQYTYNATLGPALYALANVAGQYVIGNTYDPWLGNIAVGNQAWCESGSIPLDNTGQDFGKIWRNCPITNAGEDFSWYQSTTNDGASWSPLVQTTLPAPGTPTVGTLLPNGEYAVIGNPFPNRASEFIATFGPAPSTSMNHLWAGAVATSIPQYAPNSSTNSACSATYNPAYPQNNCVAYTPWYPASNGSKNGGPTYEGIAVDTTDGLLIWSFSIGKESQFIGMVPLADVE